MCGGACPRKPSCYPCAAKVAEVLLVDDVAKLGQFWVFTERFDVERARTLGKRWHEPRDVLGSLLAGLAIGMLAIGDRDAALCYAGLALRTGPTAHDAYCCSAAEVLFSPRVFRAGSELALIARLSETIVWRQDSGAAWGLP